MLAERQTGGRGREGRAWQSPPGGLYLSLLLRPSGAKAALLPLAAASFHILLALAEEDRHGYAILLDVDNGPEGLTRAANDGLYSPQGLANAKQALRPGGILAVWSAAPDTAFGRQLERSSFSVETVKVRARETGKGATHIIWLATKR